MKTGRVWIALAFTIAGYALLWICLKPAAFVERNSDFGCFYRAGRMVLAGEGAQAYDLHAEQRFDAQMGMRTFDGEGRFVSLPFLFAPFSLAWFALLACLCYPQAEAAWYVANVAMLLIIPFLLRRRSDRGTCYLICAWLVPLVFLPVILSLMQGQPSVLLVLFFAAAYADLRGGLEARAGCWLALAAFKPQFVLPVVLALTVWRKWKTIRGFALASAALVVVSAALVGWETALRYPLALLQYSAMAYSPAGEHPESMANLRGVVDQLFRTHLPASALAAVTLMASLLVLGGTMSVLRRSRISEASFSLVVVVSVLVSYHAYLHDVSLLLLPILLLSPPLWRRPFTRTQIIKSGCIAAILLAPLALTSLGFAALVITIAAASLAVTLAVDLWNERQSVPGLSRVKRSASEERVLVAG